MGRQEDLGWGVRATAAPAQHHWLGDPEPLCPSLGFRPHRERRREPAGLGSFSRGSWQGKLSRRGPPARQSVAEWGRGPGPVPTSGVRATPANTSPASEDPQVASPAVPALLPRAPWSSVARGLGPRGLRGTGTGTQASGTPCQPRQSPGLTGNRAGRSWTRGAGGASKAEPVKTHGGTRIPERTL